MIIKSSWQAYPTFSVLRPIFFSILFDLWHRMPSAISYRNTAWPSSCGKIDGLVSIEDYSRIMAAARSRMHIGVMDRCVFYLLYCNIYNLFKTISQSYGIAPLETMVMRML